MLRIPTTTLGPVQVYLNSSASTTGSTTESSTYACASGGESRPSAGVTLNGFEQDLYTGGIITRIVSWKQASERCRSVVQYAPVFRYTHASYFSSSEAISPSVRMSADLKLGAALAYGTFRG